MADFSEQINQFAQKTQEKANRVVRASCLTLFSRIVTRTPVDTGRARANWQIELDAMPKSVSLQDTDQTGAKTINKAQATLGGVNKNTRMVGIANNVVYIKPLEYGHSKQAPNGMVRVSVAEWDEIVKTIATEK